MDDRSMSTPLQALLLPAAGAGVGLVSYKLIERDYGDQNMNAEFYDPVPDLRPWMGHSFKERLMEPFYVDAQAQNHCDPVNRAFIRSDDSTSHGRYCLYFTLSAMQPLNETCRRLIGLDVPSDRLFWRGDVLIIRYGGELGMAHDYLNVNHAACAPVANLIKQAYTSWGLERIRKERSAFGHEYGCDDL